MQHKKHFPQKLIFINTIFKEIQAGEDVWVGSERECVVGFFCFFNYRYYLPTFYSRPVMEDRQNNSHPIINYSCRIISSYSVSLSHPIGEGMVPPSFLKLGAFP